MRVPTLCFLLALMLVISGCGGGASKPISVSLTPGSAQALDLGQSATLTAAVANDSKNGGVAWTLTGPGALSNQSTTGVTYTAPSSGSGGTATVTAASATLPSATATLAITVTAPPSITTTSLPAGTEGTAYNQTVAVSGGAGTLSYSLSTGTLPTGLSLSSTSGAITGTPTGPNTASSFTVKVTDSSNAGPQSATQVLSITVNLPGAPSLSPTTLPGGNQGTAYNQTITVSGGLSPYSGWTVSSGTLPTGVTLTGNGSSATVAGNPSATGTFTFTVSVNDSSNPAQTASQSYTVIIGAPLPLSVTTSSLPGGTVNTAYPSTSLAATGGIAPYTWAWAAASGSQIPPGLSLSTAGQITGTPTMMGAFSVVVTVTDSATPTAGTANATLGIAVSAASTCGSGSESLLSGGYAFVLKGFDNATPANPALVGGVLTFNGTNGNGLITGEIDTNLVGGFSPTLAVTSGTYSVGSDQRGCMTITTSVGMNNYRFSVGDIIGGVASTAHVINFDPAGTSAGPFTAGTMRKQNPGPFTNATINGTYAFGGSSIQNINVCVNSTTNCGGKSAVVGLITLNSGSVNGGSEDINQNGILDGSSANTSWPSTSPTISSGSYNISSNGRGTLTFTSSVNGVAAGTSNSVLYVVSSSEAFFMSSDMQTTSTIVAGEALLQSGTPFIRNPLSGNYVGYDSGFGSGGVGTDKTDILLLGPLTLRSNPLAGTQLRNDAGTFSSSAISGTYSVSPEGRMIVAGAGTHAPVLYLVNTSQAFFLNSNSGVDSGFFEAQNASHSPTNGTYAFSTIDPQGSSVGLNEGVAIFTTATGSGSINVTSDHNSSGTLTPNQTQVNVMYSVDTAGLGLIPAGCTVSATSTTCETAFYVISPTKAVLMEVRSTKTDPSIQIPEQ